MATGSAPTEQVFFQDGGVSVTGQRFVVPGRTYAMHMISSVATQELRPAKFWPVSVIVIGGVMVLSTAGGTAAGDLPGAAAAMGIALGLVVVALGVIWVSKLRSKYAVLVTTAGGDQEALVDDDQDRSFDIVQALNKAIVSGR